ncbi:MULTISPECIES: response regulator [Aestuariibaculum]|uniref:Response regulator transcription factor n=1 Tax=Aestuariibaculum lutulentum TaxID=2920935 RepID=A0ABS9RM08_9FLAO|nr:MULTISPECIES: response regulator transcription factor [Aestuariibaculum]MCH4553152.1 response regulator transcription factor [Aestuariibaculum lutulentum]MCR8668877.1 response regulator transcription factor [Aestuariibaculum sp. M13]
MVKVLIADNHPITRKGLEVLFSASSNIKIVGSVDNGEAAMEFIKNNPVDILLTEADLPKLNGLTILRYLKKDYPDVKTIIFSGEPEEVYAINAIKAGANGYLHKSVNVITINEAILKVAEGGIYLSNELTQQLAFGSRANKSGTFYKKLSTREAEVLKLLTIGKKNKEISKELDINEKTVSTYKARLMRKLKVTNLVDLVNQAKLKESL